MYLSTEVEKVARKFSAPPFKFDGCFTHSYEGEEYFKFILINAFSIALPSGEKFFIDSLKRNLSAIKDSKTKNAVRIFMMQEAVHSKYHIIYNKTCCKENGYSLQRLEAPFLFNSAYVANNNTAQYCLALTVCLEHLTAVASEALLTHDWLAICAPQVKEFWKWHALEEIDHRSVAYDLYLSTYNNKAFLEQVMGEVYLKFARFLEITMCNMASSDGKDTKALKCWLRESDFMVGKKGVIPYFMKLIERFYEVDFHPDSHFNLMVLESL
ncbi:metal-dependent hydrolase [Pseudoalteromonas ostreae]|uniref:metal-dependent hydrolase n=1 Tax=Pseudoalteromonas ostreae TaxID=2774154 RepID=UPI001B370018|nr:metal-dependent hydrolase [Pseudoalteromonas ostreae]